MQYTEHYNLKLPETSDAVRVDDFNENSEIIDGALNAMEISSLTGVEIWGAGSTPSNITIDGALSKLAETVPATMGTAGTLLMAGSSGGYWGRNPMYKELVGEVTVSKTGSLSTVCTLPTGWSVENLVGLYLEGTLTLVGAYNNEDSGKTIWLQFGDEPLATVYFISDESENYDATAETTVSFNGTYFGVGGSDTAKIVGYRCIGTGFSSYSTISATSLTISNNIVSEVGSAIEFFTYNSYDYNPCAKSCSGSVKLYALREVV